MDDQKDIRTMPLTEAEIRVEALKLAIQRHQLKDAERTRFKSTDFEITQTARAFEKFILKGR